MSFAVHMGEQLSSPTDRATCPCLLQLCHQHVRVRNAPRPAPGADDETNERQLCPWEAAISRRNWLRNRPLNYSAIVHQRSQTSGENDTEFLLLWHSRASGQRQRTDRLHRHLKEQENEDNRATWQTNDTRQGTKSEQFQNVGPGTRFLGSKS